MLLHLLRGADQTGAGGCELMLWCRCGVLLVLCICPLSCLPMSPCPPGCCCPQPGHLVLCESLGLRSLPRSVPPGTSALSVARNQLCNVDHLFRPFSSLQELSLSQNQLARFPRGLPPSLESLLLQENRITLITQGALRHLVNLTCLDLEHNRIRAIQPGALQGLGKLRVLRLKGNNLTALPRNLPPSLTHLDLSANCISALDAASLSGLVNLQVLKINSNCLRSVPDAAFDRLPRLRSLDLTDNRWVCQCDILYLYRWMLSGRLKMATDLVCAEPLHLAHRLLLNLSVVAICPRVLTQRLTSQQVDLRRLDPVTLRPTDHSLFDITRRSGLSRDVPETRVLPEHYLLQTLTYEECLFLNETQSVSPSQLKTATPRPGEEQKCGENVTGGSHRIDTTSVKDVQPLLPTNREAPWPTPTPRLLAQQSPEVLIALLSVLCVLVSVLVLAVVLVLKVVLRHQMRVAPLNAGSAG